MGLKQKLAPLIMCICDVSTVREMFVEEKTIKTGPERTIHLAVVPSILDRSSLKTILYLSLFS